MKYEKSCGAVCLQITENSIKVLLVCHKYGGHWAFPKGHVENGESERQTAIREVCEETGVTIEIMDGFRHTGKYSPARGIMKEVVYFIATPKTSEITPQLEEVRQAEFVDITEAKKQLTYPADKALLDKVLDFIKK